MADISQSHFRFGKEELFEATHTFWQLEDVDHSQEITANWAFLLRFCEQVTTAVSNVDTQFQYNKSGAGWVNITTTSSIVKAVASVAFTDAQACTKRLSGTGTFEISGAGCTEDGLSGGTANDIVLNGNSETEAALQVVFADVANGDTIQFRLTSTDGTMVYTITPTLTIIKAGPVLVIPTPVSAIGGIVAPEVILGSVVIVPSFVSAIGGIVAPVVIHGSIIIIPSPISAVGDVADPTVDIQTMMIYVTPDGADAIGVTRQFTYQIAGKIHKRYKAI